MTAAGDAPTHQAVELLFVSVPLAGHLSPLVAVAAACSRRRAAAAGNKNSTAEAAAAKVAVASLSSARARVEAAGVRFVDLGEPEPGLAAEIGALVPISMSGAPSSIAASLELFALFGAAMLPPLRAVLKGGEIGAPRAIVADFVSLAGHDATEVARLPLALLHQASLSFALVAAGRPEYNLPCHVPLEGVGFAPQSEPVTLAQRLVNPLLKRLSTRAAARVMAPFRDAGRARAGLPPVAKARRGPFAPDPTLPTCHIVSGSMALETERPLPEGWHMSGPQNVDFSGGKFPLPLPDDSSSSNDGSKEAVCSASVTRFLRAAEAAGAPVVYVATGTLVTPTAAQVAAIADGVRSVRAAASGCRPRFLWSLRKECHELLPPGFLDDDAGVLVVPWAPQQAVLCHPSVRLFVTHGGLNSTYEGLAAGVPLLVLPFSADQPLNGTKVASKGFGAALDPWAMQGRDFASAVRRCLGDGGMALRARALGEELRRESGAERAAAIIGEFVGGGSG